MYGPFLTQQGDPIYITNGISESHRSLSILPNELWGHVWDRNAQPNINNGFVKFLAASDEATIRVNSVNDPRVWVAQLTGLIPGQIYSLDFSAIQLAIGEDLSRVVVGFASDSILAVSQGIAANLANPVGAPTEGLIPPGTIIQSSLQDPAGTNGNNGAYLPFNGSAGDPIIIVDDVGEVHRPTSIQAGERWGHVLDRNAQPNINTAKVRFEAADASVIISINRAGTTDVSTTVVSGLTAGAFYELDVAAIQVLTGGDITKVKILFTHDSAQSSSRITIQNLAVPLRSELRKLDVASILQVAGLEPLPPAARIGAARLGLVSRVTRDVFGVPHLLQQPNQERRSLIKFGILTAVISALPGWACQMAENMMPLDSRSQILNSARTYSEIARIDGVLMDRVENGQLQNVTTPTLIALDILNLSAIAANPASSSDEINRALSLIESNLTKLETFQNGSESFRGLFPWMSVFNGNLRYLSPGAEGAQVSFDDNANGVLILLAAAGNLWSQTAIRDQIQRIINNMKTGFQLMVDTQDTGLFYLALNRTNGQPIKSAQGQILHVGTIARETTIAIPLLLAVYGVDVNNQTGLRPSVWQNLFTNPGATAVLVPNVAGENVRILRDDFGTQGYTVASWGLVGNLDVLVGGVLAQNYHNTASAILKWVQDNQSIGVPTVTTVNGTQYGQSGIPGLGLNPAPFGDQARGIFPVFMFESMLQTDAERQIAATQIGQWAENASVIRYQNRDYLTTSRDSNGTPSRVLRSLEYLFIQLAAHPTNGLNTYLSESGLNKSFRTQIEAANANLVGVIVPEVGPSSRARAELRSGDHEHGPREILTDIEGAQQLPLTRDTDAIVFDLIRRYVIDNALATVVFQVKDQHGFFTGVSEGETGQEFIKRGVGHLTKIIDEIIAASKQSESRESWRVTVVHSEMVNELRIRVFLPIEVSLKSLTDGRYALTIFNDDQTAPVEPAFLLTDRVFAQDLLRIAKVLAQSGKDYREIRSEIEQRIKEHQAPSLVVEAEALGVVPRSELRRITVLNVADLALKILPNAYAEEPAAFNQALSDLGLAVARAPVAFSNLKLRSELRNLLVESAQSASAVKAQQIHILDGMPDDIEMFVTSKSFDLNTIAAGFGYKLVILVPGATAGETELIETALRTQLETISKAIDSQLPDSSSIVVNPISRDVREIARMLAREGYLPSPQSNLRNHTAILASNAVLSAVTQGAGVFLIADDISDDVVSRATLSYEIWQLVAGLDQQASGFMNRIVLATELIARTLETVRSELRAIARSA